MPLIENLSCPLDWARILVPGRPIKELRVWLRPAQKTPSFLAPGEAALEALLQPLTLSTAQVTVLHLPAYPPFAPVWLALPYLTAKFPSLRDLRVAVAGDFVAQPSRQAWSWARSGPALPSIDTSEQRVEEGLLDTLERDVRADVEANLTGDLECHESKLPPVLDRVMAFRGIMEEESSEVNASTTLAPSVMPQPPVLPLAPNPSRQHVQRQSSLPEGSLLAPLEWYFREYYNGSLSSRPMTSLVSQLLFDDLLYTF